MISVCQSENADNPSENKAAVIVGENHRVEKTAPRAKDLRLGDYYQCWFGLCFTDFFLDEHTKAELFLPVLIWVVFRRLEPSIITSICVVLCRFYRSLDSSVSYVFLRLSLWTKVWTCEIAVCFTGGLNLTFTPLVQVHISVKLKTRLFMSWALSNCDFLCKPGYLVVIVEQQVWASLEINGVQGV